MKFGTADSPLGASYALFTLPTAERVLTQPGKIDAIRVQAEPGVSQEELATRIQAVLPPQTEALTGAAITKEQQNEIEKNIGFISIFFTAFAVVAIVVGGFVIYNTFSIIVAQRSREMALLRAIGAARRQVLTSVVLEALVVGVVASVPRHHRWNRRRRRVESVVRRDRIRPAGDRPRRRNPPRSSPAWSSGST